jgi:hypothetical protein
MYAKLKIKERRKCKERIKEKEVYKDEKEK